MRALRLAWPEWLSAPQIALLCCAVDARYARGDFHMTARDRLSKLSLRGEIDRIGKPHTGYAGNNASGGGLRYRARLDLEDLL